MWGEICGERKRGQQRTGLMNKSSVWHTDCKCSEKKIDQRQTSMQVVMAASVVVFEVPMLSQRDIKRLVATGVIKTAMWVGSMKAPWFKKLMQTPYTHRRNWSRARYNFTFIFQRPGSSIVGSNSCISIRHILHIRLMSQQTNIRLMSRAAITRNAPAGYMFSLAFQKSESFHE